MKDFIFGFKSFFVGLSWIKKYNLWKYVLFPATLALLVAVSCIYYLHTILYGAMKQIFLYIQSNLQFEFIKNISTSETFFEFSSYLFSILLYLIFQRTIQSILILPFLGFLAERLEEIHLGKKNSLPWKEEVRNISIGIFYSFLYSILGLIIFILGFFIGPLQILLVLIVQSYILGKGSIDYFLERNYKTIYERDKKIGKMLLPTFGLGLAQFLIQFIPFLGIFIALSSSVIGASIIYYREQSTQES
ncbi:MAG: EI24 domain-containing protein [Leptospiraceae bacterium]|nr:EI24 domain-containing protein [Leptospiraceae bacterium]